MDHDFYSGFSHYWWLIFPLFWMCTAMARLWSRHTRANRALDIIKSYADQGKEPPPELLKTLQHGQELWGGYDGCGRRWRTPEERLGRAFLFAALACAFGFMAFWPQGDGNWHPHHVFGLVFVTAILVACAVSNLLSYVFQSRLLPPPYDKDGKSQ
jgi:hypothetical protein